MFARINKTPDGWKISFLSFWDTVPPSCQVPCCAAKLMRWNPKHIWLPGKRSEYFLMPGKSPNSHGESLPKIPKLIPMAPHFGPPVSSPQWPQEFPFLGCFLFCICQGVTKVTALMENSSLQVLIRIISLPDSQIGTKHDITDQMCSFKSNHHL